GGWPRGRVGREAALGLRARLAEAPTPARGRNAVHGGALGALGGSERASDSGAAPSRVFGTRFQERRGARDRDGGDDLYRGAASRGVGRADGGRHGVNRFLDRATKLLTPAR